MNTSPSIGKLAAALATAQGAMRFAVRDHENPHYKSRYADMAAVVEAVRAPLAANGIAWSQGVATNGKTVTVTTLLMHASGEFLSFDFSCEARDAGPQAIGSCVTYGRRYGLQAAVGLASDDDDGEAAEAPPPPQKRQPQRSTAQRQWQAPPARPDPNRPDPRLLERIATAPADQWARALPEEMNALGLAKTDPAMVAYRRAWLIRGDELGDAGRIALEAVNTKRDDEPDDDPMPAWAGGPQEGQP